MMNPDVTQTLQLGTVMISLPSMAYEGMQCDAKYVSLSVQPKIIVKEGKPLAELSAQELTEQTPQDAVLQPLSYFGRTGTPFNIAATLQRTTLYGSKAETFSHHKFM